MAAGSTSGSRRRQVAFIRERRRAARRGRAFLGGRSDGGGKTHLGVVAPHAGYVYSGPSRARSSPTPVVPRRVVVLAPNHTGRGARGRCGRADVRAARRRGARRRGAGGAPARQRRRLRRRPGGAPLRARARGRAAVLARAQSADAIVTPVSSAASTAPSRSRSAARWPRCRRARRGGARGGVERHEPLPARRRHAQDRRAAIERDAGVRPRAALRRRRARGHQHVRRPAGDGDAELRARGGARKARSSRTAPRPTRSAIPTASSATPGSQSIRDAGGSVERPSAGATPQKQRQNRRAFAAAKSYAIQVHATAETHIAKAKMGREADRCLGGRARMGSVGRGCRICAGRC